MLNTVSRACGRITDHKALCGVSTLRVYAHAFVQELSLHPSVIVLDTRKLVFAFLPFFFTYDDLRKSTYLNAIVRDIRVIGFSLWKILGSPLISSPYKTRKVRICPLGMSKSRAGIRPDEFQTAVPRREIASTETDETSGVSNQFRWDIERSKSSPWLLSFSFSLYISP